MEQPRPDSILSDINSFLEYGMVKFMFPEDEENFEDRPDRIRAAYTHSWKKVSEYLLKPNADWRTIEDPTDKLAGFFSRVCDMEEQPDLGPYVDLAFLGLWYETEEENIAHGILYDNVSSDAYAVAAIRDELEHIVFSGDFAESPEHMARLIMNFIITIHLTKMVQGPQSLPDRPQTELGFRIELLDRFQQDF